MERGRYHAASAATPREPEALEASNPGQGYVTTFRPEGIELASRPVARTDWRLGVRVTGYGPADDVRPLPVTDPVADQERVKYRRGPVTEWYENRPGGLEQGFTIAETDTRGRQPLALAMAIEGGLAVRLEDAHEASFHDGAGIVRVRYAGLEAWDADDRALRSWLEVSDGQLRVLVDTTGARFPVTVDPTFVQEAKLTAADGAPSDFLGESASVSGDTVVVGAFYEDAAGRPDAGSAYVFVRTGTVWSQQQKLMASDGAANDWFGRSVSVSGDTVVVGAYMDDTAAGQDAGSAYVFVRSGTVWSQQQKLTAPDGAAGDWFGYSVSVSGNTAAVAAVLDDAARGSAYVFVRTGTVWSLQQKVTASDGVASDSFGTSVSVAGDTAVVGAGYDNTTATDAGSAYVFARTGTTWSEQQRLTASDGAAGDRFGESVAVSGDTAVVGAARDDTQRGSAYVFARTGTTWTQQQKLTASDRAANDWFGHAVSVSGDVVVIGAYVDDTPAGQDAGSAYVFGRSGTVWSQHQKLTAADGAQGGAFGYSVSLSGDTAVIGASFDSPAGVQAAGSAYVFRLASIPADLAVTLSDAPDPVIGTTPLTYTLAVSNAGPGVAGSVSVSHTLPSGVTFDSASGSGWGCSESAGVVTCTRSGVAVGTAPNITVRVTPGPVATVLASSAVVSGAESDPDPADDSDSETTTVVAPLVWMGTRSKTVLADSGEFVVNGGVTYTITLTNAGTNTQTDNAGHELVDVLPSSLALASADATTGTAASDLPGNTVTWDGSLPGGGSVTVTIHATVEPRVALATTIANQATVSYDADGNGTNEATTLTDDPALSGGSDPTTVVVVSPTMDFFTLEPCRLVDTRWATGTFGGPALAAGADRVFPLIGQCLVPATARALSVNLTVTQATTAGNLRLYPAGTPLPLVSSINYVAGQTRANNAVAPLNGLGELAVRCSQASGTAHLILDVNGYFE